MAKRFSDPDQPLGTPILPENRFHVWPDDQDQYDHIELAQNWDRVDALIGRPNATDQWPPDEGIGGGIYGEIKKLQNDRNPIGAVIAWYRPSPVIPIPDGWTICDGSVVLAANHDFPGIGNFRVPDLRNRFIIGADSAKADGSIEVNTAIWNSASGAPGMVDTSTAPTGNGLHDNIGRNYTTIPDHYHEHNHIHMYNHVVNGVNADLVVDNDGFHTTDNSGTRKVARHPHNHSVREAYTSEPRVPDPNLENKRLGPLGHSPPAAQGTPTRKVTSKQRFATGGTFSDPTGGSTGDKLQVDGRPLSVGLFYIMKIKFVSTV